MSRPFAFLLAGLCALSAQGQGALAWNGFALLRASSVNESGPLVMEPISAQVQVGLDWTPTPAITAHVHLLGRTDAGDSTRGHAGIPEAYVEANVHPGGDRLRLRGGAFFLPTSRENVDSLWETAYTITPSALNSWFGEELRPIGLDASYFHGRLFGGATLFRGNDTFGALPVDRGWALRDHWIVLGERIHLPQLFPDPNEPFYDTSVSAETDHRLGWSARAGWNGQYLLAQFTHIANRSDAMDHGSLENWNTRFDVVALEYTRDDWTVAAESGWGPTVIIAEGEAFVSGLDATYLLVSRRWDRGRATIRADWFRAGDVRDRALTAAFLLTPPGRLRPGIEVTTAAGHHRALIELRYSFGG